MTTQSVSAGAAPSRSGTSPAGWNTGAVAFFATAAFTVMVFALAPWPAALKFRAALHGLCAQRVSHSFLFGGVPLPFDARMTGIYGGALLTGAYLLARGRWRAVALPSRTMLLLLLGAVALMGADGVNSTLRDFRLPYLYQPDNRLRLATGQGMGVVISTCLLYLINGTLWSRPRQTPLLRRADLVPLIALHGGFFLLILSGAGWLYVPVASALLGSAILVGFLLALALAVLAMGRDNRIGAVRDLGYLPSVALLVAIATVATLAGARFLLERLLGIPVVP